MIYLSELGLDFVSVCFALIGFYSFLLQCRSHNPIVSFVLSSFTGYKPRDLFCCCCLKPSNCTFYMHFDVKPYLVCAFSCAFTCSRWAEDPEVSFQPWYSQTACSYHRSYLVCIVVFCVVFTLNSCRTWCHSIWPLLPLHGVLKLFLIAVAFLQS